MEQLTGCEIASYRALFLVRGEQHLRVVLQMQHATWDPGHCIRSPTYTDAESGQMRSTKAPNMGRTEVGRICISAHTALES